jgi:hypothetical protein
MNQTLEKKNIAQSEMMPMEPSLFAGPVNHHDENDYRDYPVAQRPIDKPCQLIDNPLGEFPDHVHVTTSGKNNSRERGASSMITGARGRSQVMSVDPTK